MPPIRPLERGDIAGVASLYEHVSRSGSRTPPPGLAAYFERTCLDSPWADPEIPSLVVEGPDGGIEGFLASHVRRLRFEGRPIRLASGGQMVTEPEARNRAVGAFLLRSFLDGPQDVSITDTAGEVTRRMWTRLGGVITSLNSMTWTRVFLPWKLAGDRVAERRQAERLGRAVRPVASALDAVTVRALSRSLRAPRPPLDAEPLTPAAAVMHLGEITGWAQVRPDYDEPFLTWLFDRLPETHSFGDVIARLVHGVDAPVAGWYVYYSKPGGVSQVVQIVAREADIEGVLDQLIADAQERGAAALQGRVEPMLLEPLARRGAIYRWQGEALVHARDPELLSALLGGRSLVTRMEGEWWMGHHLEPFTDPS